MFGGHGVAEVEDILQLILSNSAEDVHEGIQTRSAPFTVFLSLISYAVRAAENGRKSPDVELDGDAGSIATSLCSGRGNSGLRSSSTSTALRVTLHPSPVSTFAGGHRL